MTKNKKVSRLLIYLLPLRLYDSNTVLEKLSSAIGLLQCFANLLKDKHRAAFFLSLIESPFLLQCTVEVDLVECDPNTAAFTPAFCYTVVRTT